MSVTPNFSWPLIEPTDFVTNLPADLETLADAIDADLAGLLGGTTGQVLIKDSNADHDFSWGAAASGAYTLLSTTTLSGTTTTVSNISSAYKHLYVEVENATAASAFVLQVRLDSSTTGIYGTSFKNVGTTASAITNSQIRLDDNLVTNNGNNFISLHVYNYAASFWKPFILAGIYQDNGASAPVGRGAIGGRADTSPIDSLQITSDQSLTGGTLRIYGVN